MQLVFTGDFYQLPPVCIGGGGGRDPPFAFASGVWGDARMAGAYTRPLFSSTRALSVVWGVRLEVV